MSDPYEITERIRLIKQTRIRYVSRGGAYFMATPDNIATSRRAGEHSDQRIGHDFSALRCAQKGRK